MATLTPKLGLRKPDGTDLVNVLTDINENADDLDKVSKGEITFKAITVGPAAFTAATDLIVADPFTPLAAQRLLVQFDLLVQSTVANDIVQFTLSDSVAGALKTFFAECTRAGIAYPASGFYRSGGLTAVAHTIKLIAQRISGTGNITIPVSASGPGQLLITDLGQP